jgi:hypothetical protein
VICIGKPWAGRNVIFCTGYTSASGRSRKSKRWSKLARMMVASCNAKDWAGMEPEDEKNID